MITPVFVRRPNNSLPAHKPLLDDANHGSLRDPIA
jgi:hypothetical protein